MSIVRTLSICLFLLNTYFVDSEVCTGLTDSPDLSHIEIDITEEKVDFELRDITDPTGYELKMTLAWNILGSNGSDFDGILYKIQHDRDKSSVQPVGLPPSFPVIPGETDESLFDLCNGLNVTMWAVNEEGDPVQCQTPCSDYFSPPCLFSDVCRKLSDGYTALSKDQRYIEIPVQFATNYDMDIMVYRNWFTGHLYTYEGDKKTKYCRHELKTVHPDLEHDNIHEFCETTQSFGSSYSTGPPSDLEMYKDEINLVTNRATVAFRWKAPHDIAKYAVLLEFQIAFTGGKPDNTLVNVREEINSTISPEEFYTLQVKDLTMGKVNRIIITPFVHITSHETCAHKCSAYGAQLTEIYFIDDVDACIGNEYTSRYCDVIADCTDMPSSAETSATCTCPEGYDGNGINSTWEGGTGCFDFDACSPLSNMNLTCDPNANCIDQPPPSMEVECVCPPEYLGDGYRSGSGCTRRSLVIALGVVIPLVAIIVVLICLAIWRYRVRKKRDMERIQSVFLAADGNSNGYHTPVTLIKNGNTIYTKSTDGIFGAQWELDRRSIELKEIIGRGNYGVVHKAVLKSDDGEKFVAVKMTSENYSEAVKQQFLTEISLISSLGTHENLMGMVGCCTTGESPLYLVSDFMKYGDLLHFLWGAREVKKRESETTYRLTEKEICMMGQQIASGMKYLTEIKIIHGDLAARNILVGEGLQCKISDFGLANDVYRCGKIQDATEKTVPLKWVSPERLMGGTVPITWRSDVWSFGILLYEAVTLGASPYPNVPRHDLFEKLKSGYRMERPVSCSNHLYELMLKCWQWQPAKRPTFKQIKDQLYAPNPSEIYVNLHALVPELSEDSDSVDSNLNGGTLLPLNGHIDIPIQAPNNNGTHIVENGVESIVV